MNRRRKFNNVIVFEGKEKFDSKKEYGRWNELRLLETQGIISNLKRQVEFILVEKSRYGRKRVYIADFTYWMDGEYIVEDVKSEITKKDRIYRYKKRDMAEKYGIIITET